ncbi:ABC transporter permease [Roseivirga sp. UBA838]|uniref:ABC transporter permease n=1 Tax=Roseivirga sp. UBA838 TaxID=1947393 RepID=UPI00257BEDC7|nr:ABC transporter permease [Roseivirga sp. UBA838]
MIRSYLKTTLRAIQRSPLSSFINIFGLATALGVAIMVYAFIDLDLSIDQFHENKKEIYLATSYLNRNGEVGHHGIVPAPYAAILQNDFPQISQVVRVERRSGILKSGPNVFNQSFSFVDPEFLELFTFPLAYGQKEALETPNQIILSHNAAVKYFGEENALGKSMTFDFEGRKFSFEVAGVAQEFPRRSSLNFEVLVNFGQLEVIDPDYSLSDWSRFLDAVYIRTSDPQSVAQVERSVQQHIKTQNAVQKDWPATAFSFVPWTDLFVQAEDMSSVMTGEGDSVARIVLSVIGAFVLVLAVFNYINIAIVSATKRLKEIGVRKVMGGTRKALVFQFLVENIVLTLLALVFGFILAITLLIPGFDRLFDVGLDFHTNQPELWIFLLVLVVSTGLLSGAYPALYISRFNAVNIFRGSLKFGGKNILTKIFLTFQYILALIAVVGGILFTQNTAFQKDRDWGYDQSRVISAFVGDATQVKQLTNALQQNPRVESVSASMGHLNRSTSNKIVQVIDQKYDIPCLIVDHNYLETLGLKLLEGRNFDAQRENDYQNVLVNQKMARLLNPEKALGESFRIDSLTYRVAGVVEDFHQWSFYDPIKPMIIMLAKEEQYRYFSMKVNEGSLTSAYEDLEKTWAKLFPDKPFDGYYQASSLDWYFRNIEGHSRLMQYVATICILLSCLGLYGLVSLNVASRVREFSIRKALGARLKNLVYVINKQFAVFLIIALILGIPISYYLLTMLFDSVYAVHVPITWLPFSLALAVVILMVALTISSQVRKVMTTSPTEGLRSE